MGLQRAGAHGKGEPVSAGVQEAMHECDSAVRPVGAHTLRARRLGIDACQELVVYMRSDCPVCRSEGFEVRSRIALQLDQRSIVATLNVVTSDLLGHAEVGLSEQAWHALGAAPGDVVALSHAPAIESFSAVRGKIYGNAIGEADAVAIMTDVVAGNYAEIEIAAFVTACASRPMAVDEIIALTRAMVGVGACLAWPERPVVDKHCVGGLPGNRTSLLVVPIVAACGLVMPKTSSRAITSPAGTADVMETLAPVALSIPQMRAVVAREGACIVWGGTANLSPADDILIRVERPLDLDSEGQLVASVLSKKIAAGSTHVVIDIPLGPTAKVRTAAAAASLGELFVTVGRAFGLTVKTVVSNGMAPVGSGIGPALEARDVLAVLQNHADAPRDLRERSLLLAGQVLELGMKAAPGAGLAMARDALATGAAWAKFQAICAAQGGMRAPPQARYRHALLATARGHVVAVDNRRLARIAKLAGAPKAAAAGVDYHAPIGRQVDIGQPLLTIYAASHGELAYALAYAQAQGDLVSIAELP